MRAEKSHPGEKAALPLDGQQQSTEYPFRIILSPAAESYIGKLGDDLAFGNVATHQLSPALSNMYWLAFWAGNQTHNAGCHAELERLRWERDLWYFVANNKGKRPSDFYTAATDALWAEASI